MRGGGGGALANFLYQLLIAIIRAAQHRFGTWGAVLLAAAVLVVVVWFGYNFLTGRGALD